MENVVHIHASACTHETIYFLAQADYIQRIQLIEENILKLLLGICSVDEWKPDARHNVIIKNNNTNDVYSLSYM